ncbi:ABC transporter permease [Oscillibacter hominis]|uniref:ABC transporter permease n=1 Tax=Oscillibacter hominis TaxID=2763056 RepID=A0A7G9B520_9FIRM|nr:ABC transporter permease [Oscillibacter hominis]QNL44651.1 ABC transporter permease [Oscillibacter hominis]
MNITQAIKMAIKSILSNRGRSMLTMLGIIIGIASVMTIVSTVNGSNLEMQKYYESLGTNKINVSAYQWNNKDIFDELYDYCNSLSDYVLGVTPNASFGATVVYGNKSSAKMGGGGMYYGGGMAVSMDGGGGGMDNVYPPQLYFGSDQYAICNNFQIAQGRDLSKIDIDSYGQVCVLGARAAQTFFDYADPVGKEIQVNGNPFLVIGVYAEKDPDSDWSMDNIIVFPYTASRLLAPDQQMSEFVVKAASKEATTQAISRIDAFLGGIIDMNQGWKQVYSENQWQESNNQATMMMSLVLGGIAFISLLVGGIGIMNIMLVTVTERTREIGIRRAIGAERRSIVTQFLIEAAMICGVGGILGIILGILCTLIAGKLLLHLILFPPAWITLSAFILSVALGIIFGIYPAMKASRLQPVEALRAE